jgi:hypothetical protein
VGNSAQYGNSKPISVLFYHHHGMYASLQEVLDRHGFLAAKNSRAKSCSEKISLSVTNS